MSQPPAAATDVLVVGAGPAGSACALALARGGLKVMLVDQHDFPRDKVCGDGLIPDAHHALARLGLLDEVLALAQPVGHVGCVAPRGGRIDVPGQLAVLPRKLLDDVIKRGAERAGAVFHAPWRFVGPLEENGRVVGAKLQAPHGEAVHEVRARWTVLATGANPRALQAAGVCLRHTPSGVALRGYLHHPGMVGRIRALEVVWHKRLARGYGWIFPAPDGVFNLGVGLAHSHAHDAQGKGSMQDVNLRAMLDTFCEVHAPARELVEGGRWLGPPKGAPLRCSLDGAAYSRPGLLVTGEAAGSTYAFTGEGIGKAMETGLLAAEALLAQPAIRPPRGHDAAPTAQTRSPEPTAMTAAPLETEAIQAAAGSGAQASADAAVTGAYAQALAALKPRFDLYERANRVNDHPWLADLLVWRANRSPRILRRMAGVLEEKGNPGNLVSLRGIARLFLPLR